MRRLLALLLATFVVSACGASEPQATPAVPSAVLSDAAPATQPLSASHPRLWLTPPDVERLRGWAVASNPAYAEGLAPLVERARAEMDEGRVPAEDCGQRAYSEYPTEAYAELFAFMALVDPSAAARADYAARARTLLMHVMDAAAQGPAAERSFACPGDDSGPIYYPPFRDPAFFTEDSDRPRWHGEAFALTVDWIYPSLSAADKATIRAVFTRWGQEIIERGYHHPEPVGLLRDPQLLADRAQVRWAGNNYFAAHMRNLGMIALALDPADSSPQLQGYLDTATGAWLYLFDEATRSDARGGLLPEGFEYSPQTASYAIQLLLALRSAGEADVARRGPQVALDGNPFWDDLVTAYLHSLSPATVQEEGVGPVFQPAWYGDAQRYHLADFIDAFGALAAHDRLAGNAARLEALRWIQINSAPGGAANLLERVRRPDYFRSAILYFMLLDPAAATPADPRAGRATSFVAPGTQRLFSRTGWGADATWLTYALPWNTIDHQHAEGNHFELYRDGEWLTKARVGYANIAEGIASSEFRNSVAIENARPLDRSDDDWRIDLWRRGSQWNLVGGEPGPLLRSFGPGYTYAAGDATNLYNAVGEGATEVAHASRALIWLQPDIVVVYDRAEAPAERFKRFWLQLPRPATIDGLRATMTTARGQRLFVSSLLPAGASMRLANPAEDAVGETVATDEPMTERLVVEAPAAASVRFLHVLEGADAGAGSAAATLLRSSAGDAYEGALVRGTTVLFPVSAGQPFGGTSYSAPADTATHLISGLTPGGAYSATLTTEAGQLRVSIQAGGDLRADAGGVLRLGEAPAASVLYLPLLRA